jgi:hypothetical protein
MDSETTTQLAWLTEGRDVAVLYWPREADEAARLESEGIAHLLLVEDGAAPPVSASCLEDWLMLPATDREVHIRLVNLAKRAANHPRRPSVDEFGQLKYGARSVFLSPIDNRLARALIENFGAVVAEPELIDQVWPEGATNQALRVHFSRLRQRIASLDLTIQCVRHAGYLMAESGTVNPGAVAASASSG